MHLKTREDREKALQGGKELAREAGTNEHMDGEVSLFASAAKKLRLKCVITVINVIYYITILLTVISVHFNFLAHLAHSYFLSDF